MIIGTTVEDSYDFIRFIRDQTRMTNQIKEWSDEDLEAFYDYIEGLWGYDEVINEMTIWDMLRFEFVVYKAGDSKEHLDWMDFLLEYHTNLEEATDLEFDEIVKKFETDKDFRELCIDKLNEDCYCFFIASNDDIIVENN